MTYQRVFIDLWSPFTGAMTLVLVSILLMTNGQSWGIFSGVLLWGDHLNYALGLGPALGIHHLPENPLFHHISLMNISLLMGSFSAALLARQFTLSRSPSLEYLRAVFGGAMMAAGAVLAGGCTTGGFFTPLLLSSAAGWAMMAGLAVGAYLGIKLLSWSMRNIHWGSTPVPRGKIHPQLNNYRPVLGLLLLVAILAWALAWRLSSSPFLNTRSLLVISGLVLGFGLQRSRFCFSQVFHGPIIGIGSEMGLALIKALSIGIPLAAIVLERGYIDAYQAIPTTFWLGSLLGGLLFGIGMVSAGGCGSGTLWRAGEGHLKLWLALVTFAWTGSLIRGLLKQQGILDTDFDIRFMNGAAEMSALGFQAYLPDMLGGWMATFAICFSGLLICWWVLREKN
ncbi:MAG: YeeE/YedE thiosulfate transporter family protein [Halioglobus sp.]